MHKYQQNAARSFLKEQLSELDEDTTIIERRSDRQKSMTDHNYLIFNPSLNGLLRPIKHKIDNRQELGRILTDKVYDKKTFQK
jgi:hypothetical protein